jgi:hypothetical protein
MPAFGEHDHRDECGSGYPAGSLQIRDCFARSMIFGGKA